MLYKNIMVAYDGSEPAKEALVVARNMIGDKADALMHVVSIIPVGTIGINSDSTIQPIMNVADFFPDMDSYEDILSNAKEQTISNMKDDVINLLEDAVCQVHLEAYIATKPAEGICEYAKEHDVDMIVMGRRGLSALRAMLGGVSYAVLHESEIPVVTVR